MKGLVIIASSTCTPSAMVSSGLHPIVTTCDLHATAAELSTTAVTASTTRISLDRTTASRLLDSGARRSQWARVQDAWSVDGLAATRRQPAPPRAGAADADGRAAAANADGRADATPADGRAETASATPAPKPNSGTSRVELTIDSLRSYELVKPIPVFVESLGERHYVAEVPDLNITTSASSLSEILIVLKDSITQTYDELRIRKNQDSEQARRLKTLESYIGKSKRGWLDRR
jgi:hypothetical protein